MDQTLQYLREILSNYTEQYSICQEMYEMIGQKSFSSEGAFVRALSEEEISMLNKILPEEINHAKEVLDYKRANELNEVYELLF